MPENPPQYTRLALFRRPRSVKGCGKGDSASRAAFGRSEGKSADFLTRRKRIVRKFPKRLFSRVSILDFLNFENSFFGLYSRKIGF